MSDLPGPRTDFHTCGAEFLLRDLDLALTLMDLASVSAGSEHQQRAHSHAMVAHQAVLRFLPKVRPGSIQKQMIQQKLALLEARMTAVGLSSEPVA